MSEIETYETDPAVQAAAHRRADIQAQREAAVAERGRLRPEGAGGPLPFSLDYLRADERVAALDRPVAEADREVEAAVRAARQRIAAARRPGHDALMHRLIDAVEVAIGRAAALREHVGGTADALGFAPACDPIPGLALVAAQLATLRTEIARRDRPDDGPAIVRDGKVRLKFLTGCRGPDALTYHSIGDVADYDAKNARDLIERRAAVAVPS